MGDVPDSLAQLRFRVGVNMYVYPASMSSKVSEYTVPIGAEMAHF